MSGMDGNDTLMGAAGNDSLEGGAGTDTARYGGNRSDYTIMATINGYTIADSKASRDGTDTLTDMEILQFADISVNLGSKNILTGAVTITGTPTQGQTLTAVNTLAAPSS